ncbi:hypothetical protein SEEC5569_25865, partial [Salmonella enterica subsp. enterica serovar Cerro str. 5569]
DIATVIASTAAAIFLLVINIILSPELTIHGIKLTITIVKIKPVKRFSVKPDCAGVYHAGDSHFLLFR